MYHQINGFQPNDIDDDIIIYPLRVFFSPIGWGYRIHWLYLCRRLRSPPPNEYPGYYTKQSDGEVPVMLELWGIWSTPSLLLLPGPLWPGVVAPDRGPIYGLNRTKPWFWQLNCVLEFKLRAYAKLNCLKWNCFWHWNCTYTKLNCLI